MNELIKKVMSNKLFSFVIFLSLFCVLFVSGSSINHAKIITSPEEAFIENGLVFEKKVSYLFSISDKLQGSGAANLVIDDDKLTGVANGVGTTGHGRVDLQSKMEGKVNRDNGVVSLIIDGVGNPIKAGIPSKVIYKGPIKGSLSGSKLILKGKVNIEGWVATCTGFKDKEELIIEIDDPAIVQMLKKATRKIVFLGM